ncbi:MAG: glycerate-2-kinase family protein, partial [Pyrinomonadaceae bacterium]
MTPVPGKLRSMALTIFREALAAVDPITLIRNAVELDDQILTIRTTNERQPGFRYNLASSGTERPIYSIAFGKAASNMARALEEILGSQLKAGIISASPHFQSTRSSLSSRWQIFTGGHPTPNEESIIAAQASLKLLRQADAENALVIFLISGGGSAMMDAPRDSLLTLAELQQTNHLLVTSGAPIAEVNTVRRAISMIKGGGLSSAAPNTDQISLIISDTNKGDERNVSSGPTFLFEEKENAIQVLRKYSLDSRLPQAITKLIEMYHPPA